MIKKLPNCKGESNNIKTFYITNDADFEFKDIGDWVFTSEMYRELHLEAMR